MGNTMNETVYTMYASNALYHKKAKTLEEIYVYHFPSMSNPSQNQPVYCIRRTFYLRIINYLWCCGVRYSNTENVPTANIT